MLTPEQLEARKLTLGASEVGGVLGLNPHQSPLDVWSRKRRGPNGEVPSLVEPAAVDAEQADPDDPMVGADPRTVGSILEAGVAELYCYRTGAIIVPGGDQTIRITGTTWATATPDRIVEIEGHKRGLEIKVVGRWRVDEWPGDGMPDHVRMQCQWGMAATGLEAWDVAALLNGTSLRILRVERDDALIATTHAYCSAWWQRYVFGDAMPPATDGGDAIKALARQHPRSNGETVEAPDGTEQLARALYHARERGKAAKAEAAALTAAMAQLVGDNKSIRGDWGSFAWRDRDGSVSWKSVAAEITGGAFDTAMVERHRGAGGRQQGFYPSKSAKEKWGNDDE